LLVVVQIPNIIGLFFDDAGSLLTVESHPFSSSVLRAVQTTGIREAFCTGGDEELNRLLSRLGFVEAVIKVKRFFLPAYHVGIIDFPAYYEEVLRNPEICSEDERSIARQTYSRWFDEGLFELWLNSGTDLWITNTGEIESS
jgi:hypothetical protein